MYIFDEIHFSDSTSVGEGTKYIKRWKKNEVWFYVMLNKGLDKGNLSYIDQVKNTLADCGVLEKMKRRRKWTTQDSTWNL